MRLILDTHILLWSLSESRSLSSDARELLLDPDHEKYASTVSLWEIAIKHRLGRARHDALPFGVKKTLELIHLAGLNILPVTPSHTIAFEELPLDRHADPFDRMLVAQAIAEPMRLLTHDTALATYGNHIILV